MATTIHLGVAIHLGPILSFRGFDKTSGLWRVSALVVANKGAKPTSAITSGTVAGPIVLKTHHNYQALRFDMEVPVTTKQQKIGYTIDGQRHDFHVPAQGVPTRLAYASCNGFSSPDLMSGFQGEKHINERWLHMDSRHRSQDAISRLSNEGGWKSGPLHLLLMGGDQVYCDGVLNGGSKAIDDWNTSWWQFWKQDKTKVPFSAQMKAEVDAFYFENAYMRRGWSNPTMAKMLASVPTFMMWDDHDIFDGWGSHKEELQRSKVWQGIFGIAKDHFEVFQLQTEPGKAAPGSLTSKPGFSRGFHLGPLAVLAPDMRSSRTNHQVLAETEWKAIFQWLHGLQSLPEDERPQHLIVMSSIPVIYASLQFAEEALAAIPGQQEMEDDLRDHWCSRLHFNEQAALIRRLLNFAVAAKCRVTIVSGDVHVAACGRVTSTLPEHRDQGYASRINQLVSSGIVHPPPTAGQAFFIDHLLAGDPPELGSGLVAELPNLPGTRSRLRAKRNWLSLTLDDDKTLRRVWADWWFEGENEAPITLVIHPVKWAEQMVEEAAQAAKPK